MAGNTKRRRKKATGTPQYTTTQAYGFSPIIRCWCGGSFEIAISADAERTWNERLEDMYHALNAFYDTHNECANPATREQEKEHA